jgi:hypothetical protein
MTTKDKDSTDKPTDEKSMKQLKSTSLPPDDPIYTRDFVIGMIGRNRLSTPIDGETESTEPPNGSEKQDDD